MRRCPVNILFSFSPATPSPRNSRPCERCVRSDRRYGTGGVAVHEVVPASRRAGLVYGNTGGNHLYGNAGDDRLYGGQDVIVDGARWGERLHIARDINGTGVTTAADLPARLSDNDAGQAVLYLSGGHSVTFLNYSSSWFITSDFLIF